MNIDLYRVHLQQFMTFLKESGHDISLSGRWDKLQEEITELGNAEGRDEKIKEIADCLNVLFSMMDILEVADPLHVAYEKLVSTKAKYLAAKI